MSSGGLEFVYSGGTTSGAVIGTLGGYLVVAPHGKRERRAQAAQHRRLDRGVVVPTSSPSPLALPCRYTAPSTSRSAARRRGSTLSRDGATVSASVTDSSNETILRERCGRASRRSGTAEPRTSTRARYRQLHDGQQWRQRVGFYSSTVRRSAPRVSSGGAEYIFSGGTASFTTVSGGGGDYVYSRGITRSATISAGGYQTISNGGVASYTTISGGGAQYILSGGVTSFTVVSSGGDEAIYSNGVAAFTTVSSGGVAFVSAGAVTSSAIVGLSGIEFVYSTGVASDTVVSSGGFLVVVPGGVANGTTGGGTVVSTGVVIDQPGAGGDLFAHAPNLRRHDRLGEG